MKKLILLLFLILSNSLQALEYYTVKEYLEKEPHQKEISEKFVKLVQNKAVALKEKNKKAVKIVFVYPGNQVSDYWRRSIKSFEKRMDELNINYILEEHFTKPTIEISKQIKYLLDALSNDTDYLIYTLDLKKHIKLIEKILNYKDTKLILQNITTPLKKWKNKQPFLYVGFDHTIGAIKIANYYKKRFKDKGKYAVMYGSFGYISDMRGKEFVKYLHKNSKLELVDEYYTNFKLDNAYNTTLDLISRRDDIDFIYACSTDIAFGVQKALKEKNLNNKIELNGWGGGSSEIKSIKEKELDLTVMRINDDNGVAMAEAIKLDILGKSDLVPTIFSGNLQIITKDSPKSKIDTLTKKAFRYSK